MTRPYLIGITGNIACGKTAVMTELEALGATIIDGDLVYRDLTGPGSELVQRLAEVFGDQIVNVDGSLNRSELRTIVFSDPVALQSLDRLTHPTIVDEVIRRIDVASTPIVATDGIKLLESRLGDECDEIWVVTCSPERQRERLMARNGVSRAEADQRIAVQPPVREKIDRADVVIANDGTIEELRDVVRAAWTQSRASAASGRYLPHGYKTLVADVARVQSEERVSNPLVVEVYYDYLCPYVYAGSLWVRDVKTALGDEVKFIWRSFPLEQVNSAEGDNWKLWEQEDSYVSRGLYAFRGAEAAKLQGPDHFINYHYSILEARHVEDKNIGRKNVVIEAARTAGLDVEAFEIALADRALMANIGKDYEHAKKTYGVFGTPTFVFPGGQAAYMKMHPKAPEEEAVAIWKDFVTTTVDRPYVHEIKRPSKPE